MEKHTSVATTGQPSHRPSLRNGLRLIERALPGVHDLVSHRHQLDSSPSGLSTSPGVPGPHAFAVRGRSARLATRPRPSHPASRFVTMRIRPSCRGGTAQIIRVELRKTEEKYFSSKQKFFLTRRANQCPAPGAVDRRDEPPPRFKGPKGARSLISVHGRFAPITTGFLQPQQMTRGARLGSANERVAL